MVNNVPTPPTPVNEPVLGYLPGSKERAELKAELLRQSNEIVEIPCLLKLVFKTAGIPLIFFISCIRFQKLGFIFLSTQ